MKHKNLALLASVLAFSIKMAMAMDLKEREPVTTPAQQKGGKVSGLLNPIEEQLEHKKSPLQGAPVSKEASSSDIEWSPVSLRKGMSSEASEDSPLVFRAATNGEPFSLGPIPESDDSESDTLLGKLNVDSPASQRAESSEN